MTNKPRSAEYCARIEDMAWSRQIEGMAIVATCDHRHRTKEAAERCAVRLWHQHFGARYGKAARRNQMYRPISETISEE